MHYGWEYPVQPSETLTASHYYRQIWDTWSFTLGQPGNFCAVIHLTKIHIVQ